MVDVHVDGADAILAFPFDLKFDLLASDGGVGILGGASLVMTAQRNQGFLLRLRRLIGLL